MATLLRVGEFATARDAIEKKLAKDGGDRQSRLIAGALAFQAGDFQRAEVLFAAARDSTIDDDASPIVSGIEPQHWLRLTAWRSGGSDSPGDELIMPERDPLGALIVGLISVDEFVTAKIAEARRLADATILSFTQSPGRDSLLDGIAHQHASEFRCTGNFVAAERALAKGDIEAGREFLAAARATKLDDLLEFHIAGAELQRLG